MNVFTELAQRVALYLSSLKPEVTIQPLEVQIKLTPAEFEGDYTVVVFPFAKKLGLLPDQVASDLGQALCQNWEMLGGFNVVKGFLNFSFTKVYWKAKLSEITASPHWGVKEVGSKAATVMIEYPSPNTNKPLHLGHLRNIFLGYSLSRIFEANGNRVIQVCLYNDRGTNISKSMLAYLKSENKKTPASSGIKGDKLVGDYYVQYNEMSKLAQEKLVAQGLTPEQAKQENPLDKEIAEMTVKWEAGDEAVRLLWKMMNDWFYQGVAETYNLLGLSYDKLYFESDVYNLGRETVKDGLEKGVFYQKEDGSVWIDLTDVGLDQKLVLRSNGTTVYITQDIALAYQKQKDFDFQHSIYVVGNEQDYHFKVLFEILKRLGMNCADHVYHLSYGMVELPSGKMKSREGTVVDADDLIEEVFSIAQQMANEQGKLSELASTQREQIYRQIGMGALRYFILKVDPKKKMIFNPQESIDFNGNTGPFIQYTHARICSILRQAESVGLYPDAEKNNWQDYKPVKAEISLIRKLDYFPMIVAEAAAQYSPALMANYLYEIASDYSSYYHDYSILKEPSAAGRLFRLALSASARKVIAQALYLIGIEAPERM
ncbi:MAG: arginine--tRNA ligase [Flavobacteriales bacterium]|nr:arginine--tRNA ligase [Flavobacteriales bacterium]